MPAVPAAAAAARLKTSKEARESGCGGGGAVPKIRTGLQLSCTQLHTLHAIPVPVFFIRGKLIPVLIFSTHC